MWKNVQTSSQMLSLAALLAVCYGIKRANAARVLCRAGIRASRRPTRAASAAGRGSQPGNRGRVVSVVALTGITGSWEHRSQCKLACQESARAQSQAKSPLLKSKAAEALWFSSLCFFFLAEIEKCEGDETKKDGDMNKYLDIISNKNIKLSERVLIPVQQYPKVRSMLGDHNQFHSEHAVSCLLWTDYIENLNTASQIIGIMCSDLFTCSSEMQ